MFIASLVAACIFALWSTECSLGKHLTKTDAGRKLERVGASLWGLLAVAFLLVAYLVA